MPQKPGDAAFWQKPGLAEGRLGAVLDRGDERRLQDTGDRARNPRSDTRQTTSVRLLIILVVRIAETDGQGGDGQHGVSERRHDRKPSAQAADERATGRNSSDASDQRESLASDLDVTPDGSRECGRV